MAKGIIPCSDISSVAINNNEAIAESIMMNIIHAQEPGYESKQLDFKIEDHGSKGIVSIPVSSVNKEAIPMKYDPENKNADENGMVPIGSNVSMSREMVRYMDIIQHKTSLHNLMTTQIKSAQIAVDLLRE